jgi:hypothetical protein
MSKLRDVLQAHVGHGPVPGAVGLAEAGHLPSSLPVRTSFARINP